MTERTCLQTIMNRVLTGYASGHRLSARQWQVCHHVQTCRTPVLGGMQLRCDHCADSPIVYHACRDRHCPRCQRQASQDWCERQMTHVLPVIYHNLVFAPPTISTPGWRPIPDNCMPCCSKVYGPPSRHSASTPSVWMDRWA